MKKKKEKIRADGVPVKEKRKVLLRFEKSEILETFTRHKLDLNRTFGSCVSVRAFSGNG